MLKEIFCLLGDNYLVHHCCGDDFDRVRRRDGDPEAVGTLLWSRNVRHGRLLLHGQHFLRTQPIRPIHRLLLSGNLSILKWSQVPHFEVEPCQAFFQRLGSSYSIPVNE